MDILSGKSDTKKVRIDLQVANHRPELWIDTSGKKPPAPYVMADAGKQRVWHWLSELKLPSSFSAAATKLFQFAKPGILLDLL